MGARHHQTRWAAATSLLFILASGAAVFPAGAAPLAPAPPSCQVNLALDQVVAHPTSSVSDSMTFAGTVDVNLGSLSGSRNLALEASATVADWPASVSPATENVSTVEQVPFNATLVVPAMEDAATRGTLTVTASFLAVPGLPGTAVTCSDSLSVTAAYPSPFPLTRARRQAPPSRSTPPPTRRRTCTNSRSTYALRANPRLPS